MNTDNRYAPGSSWVAEPDEVLAAYSARWIDRGNFMPADIVPDRQGFAYDRHQYKVILGGELARKAPHTSTGALVADITNIPWDAVGVGGDLKLTIGLRRSGSYVYCDAYLHR
jgi:hypothetical protein